MKTTTLKDAYLFIEKGEVFDAGACYSIKENDIYIIKSYQTPIAFIYNDVIFIDKTHYSATTTSKHKPAIKKARLKQYSDSYLSIPGYCNEFTKQIFLEIVKNVVSLGLYDSLPEKQETTKKQFSKI